MSVSWSAAARHLNFFRVHLLLFTFIPLILSAVFYAANGENHVRFIDALFLCVSAGMACGLVTVDLSSLTGFQQAILFILSSIGNTVFVSWVMVYIRRRYFTIRLKYIVEAEIAKRKASNQGRENSYSIGERGTLRRRFTHAFSLNRPVDSLRAGHEIEEEKGMIRRGAQSRNTISGIRPESIQRTGSEPRRIDPNGLPSRQGYIRPTAVPLSYNPTVEFQLPDEHRSPSKDSRKEQVLPSASHSGHRVENPRSESASGPAMDIVHDDRAYVPPGGVPLRRRATTYTQRSTRNVSLTQEHPLSTNTGLGGFPYPHILLLRLFRRVTLSLLRRLGKSTTLLQARANEDSNTAQYFSESFNALIGRNSKFYSLTEENMEELGGVEYRALTALLWILPLYHFGVHLLCFAVIAPYMSIPRWKEDFEPPNLHRPVSPVWYSAFQIVGAYSTSGMSLVDQSMVPFQEAYPLVFLLSFLILAGNLAFPIFLRFFIWSIIKLVPSMRLNETLQFLLDHPRRCYIYLFPAHQTWILLGIVIALNTVDWFFFLVLNIGEPTFEAIPLGVRFAIGTLQSTSVRAAGYATTPLLTLAPALLVLYVVVMYLGVYPIALSVKATNVYEEKSLGVFEEDEQGDDDSDPDVPDVEKQGVSSYWRYITWHARRQLAFDIWWLGLSLFLLCVIERGKIQNVTNFQWFNVFTMIFELISAYAGVGMSLGVPYGNFSFSGALTTASKLIIIVVMLRGRHRGLPVAIDRAVMLPFEFKKTSGTQENGTDVIHGGEENNPVSPIVSDIVRGDVERSSEKTI